MQISGYEKLTLTDFPEHIAAIVFTQGCNYKCPFCQNGGLLGFDQGLIPEKEVLDHLASRKHILEGVVVSGGEPTLQKDLKKFIKKIKAMGLKVKLDTNGSNSRVLKSLIDDGLVDYVAMDIKAMPEDYDKLTGVKVIMDEINSSIEILKNSKVPYEFRTTIVKEFHDFDKIMGLCKRFNYTNYYLQNYNDSEGVLTKGLHGFTDVELGELNEQIKIYSNVKIRGI